MKQYGGGLTPAIRTVVVVDCKVVVVSTHTRSLSVSQAVTVGKSSSGDRDGVRERWPPK